MQSMVEVVCVGNGSNKSFNSVYTDPGFCKMVIVQDDDKFPAPRLCLLRRWPNFDGGFGFSLYEDLISSGALKVQEVVRHSPAEAGGLRKNDVIVEINKENIELKSFFPLVEILKEAFAENEMELLVLAEQDAQWYRLRSITVNNNFPNIEYCETPYYGHILKPLDSMAQQGKLGNSQIEFHSSTGKLFRTTLVIDNERESVYRRVEELPSNTPVQSADQSIPPLRPDGTFRHPGADIGSVRVYYRRDQSCRLAKGDEVMADSGVGTIKERRSTPNNLNNTTTSPFSTMGKSNAEIAVDLLHDKWADLMDEYLDDKFRSGPREDKYERPDRDSSAKKSHVIRLNDPSSTMRSKSRSKSRCQSPNDASFSYLYSGRDDFQTTSATSFKDFNQRQQSPYQNTLNRGSPHTQSHNRFTSPHHTLQSPLKQKYPIQVTSAGHKSRPSQVTSPIQHTVENQTKDKSTYKLAESVETTPHTAYESTVRPLNVIYDSVISEPEIARESKITPSVSEGTPIVANVLVQKYERELKERELREQEERDRELRDREAKERVEFEQKMREQREQEIKEQRQRAEREARERLEFEEKMREQREMEERRDREARERAEYEQKMREQRQRELQEREEFERKLKEEEARERVERIEREKELRVKEEREKEQRDREREMARLEFERKIREKREREERDASEAQAALAALTTIIVTDNQEPASNKKLLQVQDEIVTTTLTTNQVYHIQTEDNQESINQVTLEPNNEMIVTDYHATYVQEDEQVQYDSASQISDEEEQRRQLAEFERQQEVMNELVGCIKHPKMQSSLETRRVYNRESFFGYGMSFHQEPISPSLPQHKLVYPRIEIEPDSPSVDAGLETNQRVVAVNNKYVNEKFYTLDDVAQEIEESYYDKHYTDITVMSADLWSKLINSPIHISEIVRVSPETVEAVEKPVVETIAVDQAEPTKVRLIKLERTYGDKQFGFDCKTLKPEMRYVASNVQPNLPAHRAGLRNNDNILEVNGEPIHMLEHEKVIKKIKSKDDQVDLLVVSDVNEYYRIVNSYKKEEMMPAESPKSSHAEVNIDLRVPNYVRYYEVKRDPSYKGLGISLTPSGVISSIEASSPAYKAGLKKDQRFVEIDGVNVKNKTNQDISKLIQGKDSLVIGVVDVDEEVEEAEKEKEYSSATNLPSEVIIGSISSKSGKKIQDQLTGFRVCNLVRRPDFDGYGFSMKANESGPHMISSVESNSPAEQSGLRADDLILKVGDQNVVGERYTKTTTLIKNECEKGLLKLEVVDPLSCPVEVRNTPLVPPSGFSTISSSSKLNKKSDSIKNLRDITSEMIDSSSPGPNRATSVDSASDRKRPYSMTDLDRIPANSTVRSITSIGTTATGYSQSNLANVSSKSVGNLSSIPAAELPKFKRCVVQLIPEYSEGFGFTLNSKLKPKYTIFSVDPDSPAYAANLRPTDVIVEINKKNIRRLKFDKVKGMLSESKTNGQVEILAISKEGYMFFKNKKKKFSSRKLVTMDNTELHSTLDGIRSRASSVNNNRVSSDHEGDKRTQSVGPAYSRPSTETPSRPRSATPTPIISPMQTDNALDDLIFCTITRSEPSQSIGMSLTKSDKDQQSNFYPMVTDVERGAPAEQAGIMVGDIVIEINGKSTLNKQNKEIRPWIEASGNNIDFIVKRDKSVELKLRQNAKVITDAVVENAVQKIASPSSSEHLSRKESFSQKASVENSPRLVHKEIHMSSSKLQDYSFESSSPKSNKSPKTRNQSEPALEETIRSENTVQSSSPVSRRSASTYTLPRDAPIPRLCRVRAYEESLGFTVSGSKSAPGVFKVTDVAANSAAANSGLRNNDYIIEVSGVNVETLNYTDLIAFIRKKKQEDDLQLLVADRPTLEWYKKKKVPISSQVVPKMQYIETLLKEELEREMANTDLDQSGLNISENLRSSDKGIKVPFQSGRSVWIHRKIYLCDKPVNNLSISHNDLSQANNV